MSEKRLCKHHPEIDYKHHWGCPDCLAELRAKNERLKNEIHKENERLTKECYILVRLGDQSKKCIIEQMTEIVRQKRQLAAQGKVIEAAKDVTYRFKYRFYDPDALMNYKEAINHLRECLATIGKGTSTTSVTMEPDA